MEQLAHEMLVASVIQLSSSPYSSLVIIVRKKDGSWRFRADYRVLNNMTVLDKYPIHIIEEIIDELHGAEYFSKFDLCLGYHQIRLKPEDVHKTSFQTQSRHYKFRVMPFSLKNAPTTFQAVMNEVFRPYLRRFILVFFDDILVLHRSFL